MGLRANLTRHIKILAMGQSRDREPFLRAEVTVGERRRRKLVSLRDVERSPRDALADLDANLITEEARREFLRRIQEAASTLVPTFRVVTRPGWTGPAFVLPNGFFVPRTADLAVSLPRAHRPYGPKFSGRLTLKGWHAIPILARGNTRLMLGIALAFVGPVADLLKSTTALIQIFGPPGAGKSAIAIAAGSVWGGDHDGVFSETWNNTANHLELVAAAHHATFLVLDETRLIDQSRGRRSEGIFSAVMRLAEGRTRGRLNQANDLFRSRTPILSTSNKSLDELALENRVSIDDAYRDRLVDVPLPFGGHGAFEDLHEHQTHHEFATELVRLAKKFHGSAAREFLVRITAELGRDEDALKAFLIERQEAYLRTAIARIPSPGRDIGRINQRFALIYAAASLAVKYDILPWTRKELCGALLACEAAHVAYVQAVASEAVEAARDADPLERLRTQVRDYVGRFVDLRRGLVDPTEEHDHTSCPGYVNSRSDGTVEYLFSDASFTEICGGNGPALRLKAELMHSGALLRDGHRPSTRRTIWASGDNRREPVIAIRASFFASREDDAGANRPPRNSSELVRFAERPRNQL
jgi:putative DNA primase/helicase